MNEKEYINNRLVDQITWHSKKALLNKILFHVFNTISIIVTMSIPIISLMSGVNTWSIVIAILGAVSSLSIGIISLFGFHNLWINYRTTSENLKHHQYLYETNTHPYNVKNKFSLLVKNVENTISEQHTKWLKEITQEEPRGRQTSKLMRR